MNLRKNLTLRSAAAVLSLTVLAGCSADQHDTPAAYETGSFQPSDPIRRAPLAPPTQEGEAPQQLAPGPTPSVPQEGGGTVGPDVPGRQDAVGPGQSPRRDEAPEDEVSWWDIVREPVAPHLGDRAATVLSRLPLYAEPSVAVTVEADPSIPVQVVEDTVALLDTLLRLVPESRMNGVEVIITSDRQWVAERIATSDRILEVERQTFLDRLADGSSGESFNYSLRGPNFEQTIVTLIVPLDLTRTVIAESVARELSPNLVSVYASGVAGDPWPCWAAEGLGYPLAWEATRRTFGGTYRQHRDFWVSQLRERTDVTLGLAASEAFRGTPDSPCFTGAGHLQGALAGEMIVADNGVGGLFYWAEASWGRSWRDGYRDVFGETVQQFYDRFDREALHQLR